MAEKKAPRIWGKTELLATRTKLKRKLVDLLGENDEVEGRMWCQEITGSQRDQWERGVAQLGKNNQVKQITKNNMRGALIALGAVDAEGTRLFNTTETDELRTLPSSKSDCLFEAICDLSGIGKKDVEDMEKNLESGQSDGSLSD